MLLDNARLEPQAGFSGVAFDIDRLAHFPARFLKRQQSRKALERETFDAHGAAGRRHFG